MAESIIAKEINFKGFKIDEYHDVLTNKAQVFLIELHEKFNQRRVKLLEEREVEQAYFDIGNLPSFPNETKKIRESNWVCAPLPEDLLDRRVEITGSVERKMVINALNSGAKTFMADFEDSNSPNIHNNLQGQINLRDAINKTISYHDDRKNKTYQLNNETATLIVRPRGLHLNEKHFIIDGEEMSGSLFDFGLYFFHNIKTLQAQNSATYFYLPKLEHYLEARLWNDIFVFAQDYLNIPQNTIKATVLVETITASFQLDEIIYELRNHMAGLNCGRWDYIFSYIKKFRNHKEFMVPNRDQITMKTPFMSAYSLLVIQRCHKRNVHAMGGMAAQIPIKNDEKANNLAFVKVKADKEHEVKNGHDGTWVAHPGLVAVAMNVFNENMMTKNQIHVKRYDVNIGVKELVEMPIGTITEEGIRKNINIGILYIESWLRGNGAAAIYNLMEDAATAEISRTQIWLWLHHEVTINNGKTFNTKTYEKFKYQEIKKIKDYVGQDRFDTGKFEEAVQLFDELVLTEDFEEFLTLKAYNQI